MATDLGPLYISSNQIHKKKKTQKNQKKLAPSRDLVSQKENKTRFTNAKAKHDGSHLSPSPYHACNFDVQKTDCARFEKKAANLQLPRLLEPAQFDVCFLLPR